MKTALEVFQKINPLMLFLYGRKPSYARAILITIIVVIIYSSIAWVSDSLFLRTITKANSPIPVMGLFEDYTHHVLLVCSFVVLLGGKQFQVFLENTAIADLQHGTEKGVVFDPRFVSRIWWACMVLCFGLFVFGQLYTPWSTETPFAASWATLPREHLGGWIAGCISSFYNFFVVFSIAIWLITSCALVVVPRLAKAIREKHVDLDPLHPDGMGGHGSLLAFGLAVMLTYVSVVAYIIAFGFAFGTSTQYLSLTSTYILLLPFVATAPFIRIHLALKGAKRAKMLKYHELHSRKLISSLIPDNSELSTDLSLSDIDSLHRRYADISTWPLSIRSAAVAAPLAIPITLNLLELAVMRDGESMLEWINRVFG